MSPSVLSYGNVDNDKVISTNAKMAEIPKRLNKTHRRFQNLALKSFFFFFFFFFFYFYILFSVC